MIHKYRQAEGLANFVTELSFATNGSVANTTPTPVNPSATPCTSGANLLQQQQLQQQQQQQDTAAAESH